MANCLKINKKSQLHFYTGEELKQGPWRQNWRRSNIYPDSNSQKLFIFVVFVIKILQFYFKTNSYKSK